LSTRPMARSRRNFRNVLSSWVFVMAATVVDQSV
jgi:hypothetical protein